MQKSNAPTQYVIPWANAGTKNAIPVASQIGITNGAASYTDGYPPLTFTPIASGGVPPFGADTNGILYNETLNTLWQQSGFHYAFNSTFNTNQGGYPAQAVLVRSDGKGLWLNLSDNNTTNPDATSPSGWASIRANIGSTTIPVVVGNNTPDPSTLGPRLLIITGSIASTASLILPLTAGASWTIQNNTSGAGSLSVQGATGSGVTVAQGTLSDVVTDGVNFYTSTFNGAGVYLPINGTAVAATKLATARVISLTGDVAWTMPAFDGTSNITTTSTIQAGVVTLAKMAAFQANSLMGNPTGSAATPSAITLTSGIQFSGTALSLGAITPSSVAATGIVSGSQINSGINFVSTTSSVVLATTGAGSVVLRPNGSGSTTGQVSIDSSGNVVAPGNITSSLAVIGATVQSTQNFVASTTAAVLATTGAGSCYMRPNGTGSTSGQLQVLSSGVVQASSDIQSPQNFVSSTANVVVATTGAGTFYVRPNGTGSTSGQMVVDSSGNLTVTGTINYNTSDARVKTRLTYREPVSMHWLPWGDYDRLDINAHGIGHLAQHVREVMPHRVHESEYMTIPGTDTPMLMLDRLGMAEEQGIWCGRQIDNLMARVKALESLLEI